jgi:hypothetical protein
MSIFCRGSLLLAAGLCLVAAGCKGVKLPKTYPATGSVQYLGGQPMKGGLVQLIPLQGDQAEGLRVSGTIREDGTFTLETLKDKHKLSGAPEGEYRVNVIPPLQNDHKGSPPIDVPGTVKVEAKENQLTIKVAP